MARDIDSIATWVTSTMLNRADLTAVARDAALTFYRLLCSKIPFDELMVTSSELPMVSGTASYDLSTLSPAINAIRDIRVNFGSVTRRVRRSDTRVYDSLSSIQNSRMATYARWGTRIEFNPPPNASTYTYRVRYWSRPTENATPYQTLLVQPLEWDELIKWETLWRVYNAIDMPEKAMLLIQPAMMPRQQSPKKTPMFEVGIIPRLWNDLLTTVSAKENTDEDFSINPVVRAYTFRG